MEGSQAAATRPRLPRRLKFGLGATAASLFILVFPGQMVLPLAALTPVMPRMGGCANFLAPVAFLALFGLAFLISCALIALGTAAIVSAARMSRFGLAGSVVTNAVVMSLLLVSPLGFSFSKDPGALSLYVLLDVCALIPAAALALLLSPATVAGWWRSPRAFVLTCIVTALLLLPGVAGLVSLGVQISGVSLVQPANTSSGGGCSAS